MLLALLSLIYRKKIKKNLFLRDEQTRQKEISFSSRLLKNGRVPFFNSTIFQIDAVFFPLKWLPPFRDQLNNLLWLQFY